MKHLKCGNYIFSGRHNNNSVSMREKSKRCKRIVKTTFQKQGLVLKDQDNNIRNRVLDCNLMPTLLDGNKS